MLIAVENPDVLRLQLANKRLVLYGMGTLGMEISRWLDGEGIEYVFADKRAKEKKEQTGRLVITPEEVVLNYRDANIIISTNVYFDEIKEGLIRHGLTEKQILSYALFVPKTVAWVDLENSINWDLMRPSVELFSHWLDDEDRSVADYGAGQMYLKNFLRQGVLYYPIDYLKRFEETIVCDLNAGTFPDLETDVAVLNGVLEFITTAEALLEHVCVKTRRKVILSYMTLERFPNIEARRASGYISNLTDRQIVQLLKMQGFCLSQIEPDPLDATDTIYLFERALQRKPV